MTEFRVRGWAIGVMRDLGKRADQCILCKVHEISDDGAVIVAHVSGKLINITSSPRSWFAPKDRDDGCSRIWASGKTQWRSYRNMLGVLAMAQVRSTQDPNKTWEPIDDNFISPAPIAPAKPAKPVQPHENKSDDDLEMHPRMVTMRKGKAAIMKECKLDAAGWEAMLDQMRFEILQGDAE